MQIAQIQERLSLIEECINDAALACQAADGVPESLRSCLTEMDQRSDEALDIVEGEDQDEIRACVDELEELGDRAMRECRDAETIEPHLREAIQRAHRELSVLKKQLH